MPTVALVGYTNAGKSTRLNALTGATVLAEDKLFATLDPTTRRLRFPDEREIVLTDTVGFIRDLPDDLVNAFRATLEELEDADLLLHVVDLADPLWEEQMASVDTVLTDLEISEMSRKVVFNKIDRVTDTPLLEALTRRFDAVCISALDAGTLRPLSQRLLDTFEGRGAWNERTLEPETPVS